MACLFFVHTGHWLLALGLFVIVELSVAGTFVFCDSLMPHIAAPDEVDRVSATGYALGYIGGGALLALNLAWIQYPQWLGLPHGDNLSEAQATLPTRIAFLSVAAWWVLFSIPLFLRVPEPQVSPKGRLPRSPGAIKQTITQLHDTVAALLEYK